MSEYLLSNKLELHYFFRDEDKTHSMDAVVRNRCEHEVLQIINTVAKELNIQIKVETEVYEKGGLVEFYNFIGTVQGQGLISLGSLGVALVTLVLSRMPQKHFKLDKKIKELTIKEKEQSIENLKLQNDLLQRELQEKSIKFTLDANKIDYLLESNIKILKHKSNFYKALNTYYKVEKISARGINKNNESVESAYFVERPDFDDFIIDNDDLEPVIDENATIEIISPVLKKGKYKWRGVYNNSMNPIEFSMKDKDFKDDIIKEGITFKNGTFIDCVLQIDRKIDDLGNEINTNYSVITVINQRFGNASIETQQGKKYRKKMLAESLQLKLF